MITNFHNKKMPKEKALCKYLAIIMLDSVIKTNKKYYPPILLEECKYAQEKIKLRIILMKIQEKVNLMMEQNLILIMMNMMNNLLKVF